MHVVMSSDDIARSVTATTVRRHQHRGGIACWSSTTASSTSSRRRRQGTPCWSCAPPDRADRLLEGLDATGTVLSINQSAQDVTEQLVDLDVRIANARASVANVREFMDQ